MEHSRLRSHLKQAISEQHHCEAEWEGSSSVHEAQFGATVWSGDVEVFKLISHPASERCFAWIESEGGIPRYVTVLASAEVRNAGDAVKARHRELEG